MTMLVRILAVILWGALSVWTVLRLWREPSEGEKEKFAYSKGVKRWGVLMWLSLSVLGPAVLPPGWSDWLSYIREAVFVLFLSLPLCLWGGYFWGLMMEHMFDTTRRH